ncbi:NUDIX hydrolase [Parafrankia discariae]|uniref:NUDIX hydrolase n=1 Tax=Parafrankia discariae TaxID=365528 RepID=UPI00036B7C70|nr:NUDIX hydrolase [Parafrankia discariae]
MPVLRRAARVVLFDPADAFLLIRSHDPDLPDGPTWWHVPGGGLDPGEEPAQAAAREIREEVGVTVADLGPCVATRTAYFTFLGVDYRQEESFFVARLPHRVDVDDAAWSAVERRATLGWHWWTLPELRTTPDTVYPPALAPFLTTWLTTGPPATPHSLT